MEFKKARKVYPLDGMVIGVLFEDGVFKKYDLEPRAAKWLVFNALRYRKFFESARVDAGGYGIVWNEDIDIAAEEVYFNGQDWPDAPREDVAVAALVARFAELRKKAKMTQQQIAEKTGINQPAIARMENGGREPQLSTMLRLFDALGYDLKPVLK